MPALPQDPRRTKGRARMNLHINYGPPMAEVWRGSFGERWCFKCRKRREFLHIICAPTVLSYYGPSHSIRCADCGGFDTDLFPGIERVWDD
jgi:hypothetical protein